MLHLKSEHPIGLFDSGIGGLTVAKTIVEWLPNENIVYFGDTAHTPWGEKSIAAIQAYSLKICDVLLQQNCKLIIIACHTASTAAFEVVRNYVGNRAHVLNVIDPVIEHIEKNYANKKVGLIGTKQTVRSNTYKKRLDSLDCNIELSALATPLLAPLIEEGFSEKEVSALVVKEYLSHPTLSNIDALILGCTHYPIIKHHIEQYYLNKIEIIDASFVTTMALKAYLTAEGLLNHKQTASQRLFYVSDYTDFFAHTAKVFFPGEIALEPYPLWD
jgi:glutamate racemase